MYGGLYEKIFAVVVTGFLLMTTACSSSSTNEYENKNTNTSTQFPITIKHAFGETTITEKPERIATIAWEIRMSHWHWELLQLVFQKEISVN